MSKDSALEQYKAAGWEAAVSTSSELPWQKTEQAPALANSDDSSHKRLMGFQFPNYYSHI